MEIQPGDKEKDGDSVDEGDDVENHGDAAEHSYAEEKDTNVEMASASEHSDHEDIHTDAEIAEYTEPAVDGDVDVGATEHGQDSILMPELMERSVNEDDAVDPKKAPPQIFQLTISLRDDWLHRGDALQDMDLQTYAEFIMREAKPIRGADMKKILTQPIFAFDEHYKLASGFMQVFRPSQRRCLARFNVPNCLRENVNEGEENAQFKAFHCSLIRCPGVGMCADPLMCASTMFPDNKGVFKYRPAWRARQAEILALAMTAYDKKIRARRFETLQDTTLWKVHRPTRVLQSTDSSHADSKLRQIDIQRWIRSVIRHLSENAPAESPCNYG